MSNNEKRVFFLAGNAHNTILSRPISEIKGRRTEAIQDYLGRARSLVGKDSGPHGYFIGFSISRDPNYDMVFIANFDEWIFKDPSHDFNVSDGVGFGFRDMSRSTKLNAMFTKYHDEIQWARDAC